MSSREIAELTGKRHPDVRRDIRSMLESLGIDVSSFARIYKDASKRNQEEFNLPKRETLILVSGYNVQMRAKNSRRPGHSWAFAPQCRQNLLAKMRHHGSSPTQEEKHHV